MRRSKRSSSGCLFSMNSWRFLNTCRKRKPVTWGTRTRQRCVSVIQRKQHCQGATETFFRQQWRCWMALPSSQRPISQYNTCVEGSSQATGVLSIQSLLSSSFRSRLQETWFCSELGAWQRKRPQSYHLSFTLHHYSSQRDPWAISHGVKLLNNSHSHCYINVSYSSIPNKPHWGRENNQSIFDYTETTNPSSVCFKFPVPSFSTTHILLL